MKRKTIHSNKRTDTAIINPEVELIDKIRSLGKDNNEFELWKTFTELTDKAKERFWRVGLWLISVCLALLVVPFSFEWVFLKGVLSSAGKLAGAASAISFIMSTSLAIYSIISLIGLSNHIKKCYYREEVILYKKSNSYKPNKFLPNKEYGMLVFLLYLIFLCGFFSFILLLF